MNKTHRVIEDEYQDKVITLQSMIEEIESHIEESLFTNDDPTWGDVADVGRCINDIQDIYDRITKRGEYA